MAPEAASPAPSTGSSGTLPPVCSAEVSATGWRAHAWPEKCGFGFRGSGWGLRWRIPNTCVWGVDAASPGATLGVRLPEDGKPAEAAPT